jgi:hypothetical protein
MWAREVYATLDNMLNFLWEILESVDLAMQTNRIWVQYPDAEKGATE